MCKLLYCDVQIVETDIWLAQHFFSLLEDSEEAEELILNVTN